MRKSSVRQTPAEVVAHTYHRYPDDHWTGSIAALVVALYNAGAAVVRVVPFGSPVTVPAIGTMTRDLRLHDPTWRGWFSVYYRGTLHHPLP